MAAKVNNSITFSYRVQVLHFSIKEEKMAQIKESISCKSGARMFKTVIISIHHKLITKIPDHSQAMSQRKPNHITVIWIK